MFKKPWENPNATYRQQSSVLKNVCDNPEAFFEYNVASKLISLYPDHILSTLTANELFRIWQINVNVGEHVSVSCEFIPDN